MQIIENQIILPFSQMRKVAHKTWTEENAKPGFEQKSEQKSEAVNDHDSLSK